MGVIPHVSDEASTVTLLTTEDMEVIILIVGNPVQFYISGTHFHRVLFHIQLMTKTNAASGSYYFIYLTYSHSHSLKRMVSSNTGTTKVIPRRVHMKPN